MHVVYGVCVWKPFCSQGLWLFIWGQFCGPGGNKKNQDIIPGGSTAKLTFYQEVLAECYFERISHVRNRAKYAGAFECHLTSCPCPTSIRVLLDWMEKHAAHYITGNKRKRQILTNIFIYATPRQTTWHLNNRPMLLQWSSLQSLTRQIL